MELVKNTDIVVLEDDKYILVFNLRLMYILNGKVSGMTKKDRNAKKQKK